MIKYVIPARLGSKRFPHKNQILFEYTAETIPLNENRNVIVSTNDLGVMIMAEDYEFEVRKRPAVLCEDRTSIKDVIIDIKESMDMEDEDTIVLLYLTYPQRTWMEIENALRFFYLTKEKSLLCQMPVLTHPYMCINKKGKQIIKHNLYRLQDYEEVYEISHFIGIFKVGEIKKLNNNMYNKSTKFYDISRVVDVDYREDMDKI